MVRGCALVKEHSGATENPEEPYEVMYLDLAGGAR